MSVIAKDARRRQALWSWFATEALAFFKKYLDAQDGQEMAGMAWDVYEMLCGYAIDCGEPCMPIPPCSKFCAGGSDKASDEDTTAAEEKRNDCAHQFVFDEITSRGTFVAMCEKCFKLQYFSLFKHGQSANFFHALPLMAQIRDAAHKAQRLGDGRNGLSHKQEGNAE